MERNQTQFLRIFDETTTYHRWQNSYISQTVTLNDRPWLYQQFSAEGITAGDVASEAGLVVELPATVFTERVVRQSLRRTYLVEILQYQFDIEANQQLVPESQRLIASYVGEVVGVRGSLTSLQMELGSLLAPVGVQMPPRTYTTFLVGVPCQL
jgi:hypothetical protein